MHVVDLIERHSDTARAVVCGDDHITWGDLRTSIGQVAARVTERTSVGDVVVVVGATSIEFVQVMLGSLAAGVTVLPLDPRYPVAELAAACELAHPALIVSVDASSAVGELGSPGMAHATANELLTGDPAGPRDVDPDTPGLLLFTSGTAGSPRLAMLSRTNLSASIRSTVTSSDRLTSVDHTVLGVMPLSHVLGIVSVLGVSLAIGATLVLTQDVSVGSVVDAVKANDVTLLVAPPIFWFRLAEADIDPVAVASVELGVSGAAPLSATLAAKVESILAIRLRQGYGLTEASPGLTSSVGTNAPAISVGRPLPGVELRLVDESGDDAAIGDVGEVWARGDNIFLGYLNDPEATAAVLDSHGWLHTGDLGVVGESGHLFLVGRSKDQIISAGFNVHPGEVEGWLLRHPGVVAAAVVGAPDPEYGEVVVAYVVPGADAPTVDALQTHCRQRLAGYKIPRVVQFVDQLPRGLGGKIQRRMLRPD